MNLLFVLQYRTYDDLWYWALQCLMTYMAALVRTLIRPSHYSVAVCLHMMLFDYKIRLFSVLQYSIYYINVFNVFMWYFMVDTLGHSKYRPERFMGFDNLEPCLEIEQILRFAYLPSGELTYPHPKALLKMIFHLPRWDMLVRRVSVPK